MNSRTELTRFFISKLVDLVVLFYKPLKKRVCTLILRKTGEEMILMDES